MEQVHGLPQPINSRPTILTIGVFDGVHQGHQHLISMVVRRAQLLDCQSAVVTFDPHPDTVLHPGKGRYYLTSLEERAERIAALGVDLLIVLPFTRELMGQSALEFMQRLCQAVALRELWAGPDLAVGHKREGNLVRLAEIGQTLGYVVHPVEPLFEGTEQVRSTRIRAALEAGDVEAASHFLGYTFELRGRVVEGDKRGRTIGFPTANLAVGSEHLLPANGVYVCRAEVNGQTYGAVTNIGVRPTFDGVQQRVEAFLLDFVGDMYGEMVRLHFLHRLRAEQRFDGIAALVAQINQDVANARAYLAEQARH